MTRILKCWICKHYKRGKNEIRRTCSAFPEGIPRKVLFEEIPHYRKMEGQIGDFVFEPIPKEEKNYVKYFDGINKLIEEKSQIKEEAFLIAKEIIANLNNNENKKCLIGEIRIHRGESRMIIKNDEILFYKADGEYELIPLGPRSKLFGKLKLMLFLESIESHKTDLEFKIFKNGDCQLNFTNLTREERLKNEEIINLINNQRRKAALVDNGLKMVSSEILEKDLEQMLEKEDKDNLPSDAELAYLFQDKGYAVLESDITQVRRKLGYKNKRELRIERLKEKYKK